MNSRRTHFWAENLIFCTIVFSLSQSRAHEDSCWFTFSSTSNLVEARSRKTGEKVYFDLSKATSPNRLGISWLHDRDFSAYAIENGRLISKPSPYWQSAVSGHVYDLSDGRMLSIDRLEHDISIKASGLATLRRISDRLNPQQTELKQLLADNVDFFSQFAELRSQDMSMALVANGTFAMVTSQKTGNIFQIFLMAPTHFVQKSEYRYTDSVYILRVQNGKNVVTGSLYDARFEEGYVFSLSDGRTLTINDLDFDIVITKK